MRRRFAIFVTIIQSILFLAHWFVYRTLANFWSLPDPPGISKLQAAFVLLSVTFVTASLLAFTLGFSTFKLGIRIFSLLGWPPE